MAEKTTKIESVEKNRRTISLELLNSPHVRVLLNELFLLLQNSKLRTSLVTPFAQMDAIILLTMDGNSQISATDVFKKIAELSNSGRYPYSKNFEQEVTRLLPISEERIAKQYFSSLVGVDANNTGQVRMIMANMDRHNISPYGLLGMGYGLEIALEIWKKRDFYQNQIFQQPPQLDVQKDKRVAETRFAVGRTGLKLPNTGETFTIIDDGEYFSEYLTIIKSEQSGLTYAIFYPYLALLNSHNRSERIGLIGAKIAHAGRIALDRIDDVSRFAPMFLLSFGAARPIEDGYVLIGKNMPMGTIIEDPSQADLGNFEGKDNKWVRAFKWLIAKRKQERKPLKQIGMEEFDEIQQYYIDQQLGILENLGPPIVYVHPGTGIIEIKEHHRIRAARELGIPIVVNPIKENFSLN